MDINDVIVQNKIKKRGRPRKNCVTSTKIKIPSEKKTENTEEDIIIHFPISSKEINNEKINGFELIETECNESISSSETDLSDDDSERTRQQLLNIIKEKDKIISDLEDKLTSANSNNTPQTVISKNVKIYPIENYLNKTIDGNIIIPEHTTKACLWDTCKINGIPCFLPDKHFEDKYYVVGMFCSLNCAIAYNINLGDFRINERFSLLKLLYSKTHEIIHPSPPCRVLEKYGGKITIEEYRNNLTKCEKEYRIIMPPMACINQTLEERLRKPECSNRKQVEKKSILTTMMSRQTLKK